MSIFPIPNVDYTARDFTALRARVFATLRVTFPDWTDDALANFGNILVESFCFVGDLASYYEDRQAAEAFFPTLKLRKNAIRLSRMVDYRPRGVSAATASVLFALSEIPANDVSIPAGTIVGTAEVTDPVEFRLLHEVVILSGANPPQAFGDVEHSSPASSTQASTGRPNQEMTLASGPFLDGSLLVVAGNGAYTVVDDLLDSTAASRHVVVFVDENERATLRFGNGTNGAIPTGVIDASYAVGGGRKGNVEATTINRIAGTFVDDLGNVVTVSVSNPERSSGGFDRETVAQIKQNAPRSLRAQNRTVAREDFEIHAMQVPGVARALMLTADQGLGIPENRGNLYIVPEGGGTPTGTLLTAVRTMIGTTKPHTITFRPNVLGALYQTVDVRVVAYFRDGYTPAAVKADVVAALERFFAVSNDDGTPNPNVDFGWNYKDDVGEPEPEIPLSDVANVVRDRPGIRKIGDRNADFLLNGEHRDVALQLYQFPALGQVTVIDGRTGQEVS